jgi:hypothetical protein
MPIRPYRLALGLGMLANAPSSPVAPSKPPQGCIGYTVAALTEKTVFEVNCAGHARLEIHGDTILVRRY